MKNVLVLIVVVLASYLVCAQDLASKGKSPVYNFAYGDYYASNQIKFGVEGEFGTYFFSAAERILEYNSGKWSYLKTDFSGLNFDALKTEELAFNTDEEISEYFKFNPSPSVFKSKDSVIYIGRKNNFGFVKKNQKNEFWYRPMCLDANLGVVNHIIGDNNGRIYFIGLYKIYRLELDGKLTLFYEIKDRQNELIQSAVSQDGASGFFLNIEKLDKEGNRELKYLFQSFKKAKPEPLNLNFNLSEFAEVKGLVMTSKQEGVLMTFYKGAFKVKFNNNAVEVYKQDANKWEALNNHEINSVAVTPNGINVSTGYSGVLSFSKEGVLLRSYGEKEKIASLNVTSTFLDSKHHLWACTDEGISCFDLSSPLSVFKSESGLLGPIEGIAVSGKSLHISTREDLFTFENNKDSIKAFNNSNSIHQRTYDVKCFEIGGELYNLIVGFDGIFGFKEGEKPELIAPLYAWTFEQSVLNENEIFVGGEFFIGRLIKTDAGWDYEEISRRNSEIRSLVSLENYLYFSEREGLFRINLDDNSVQKIENKSSHTLENSIFVLEAFKGEVYVGFLKGLVKIVGAEAVDVKLPNNKLFKNSYSIHRLRNIEDEKLCAVIYVDDKEEKPRAYFCNFVLKDDGLDFIEIDRTPLLQLEIVNAVEFSNNKMYFGGSKGLAVIDLKKYESFNTPWNVYSEIWVKSEKDGADTLENIVRSSFDKDYAFRYDDEIKLSFLNNSVYDEFNVDYKYRLKGYSDNWSEFSKKEEVQYSRLPHGNYVFQLKGKNYYDVESSILEINFKILPPWYFTWWAYILFLLALLFLIFLAIKISTSRVQKQNQLLEKTVKERTKEVEEKSNVLEIQKNELHEKNQDILDSIKYAKRIQNTILPSEESLTAYFEEHFVYYKPKDIVSGDFYWSRKVKNKVLWAAVDCTGHGVPGAFVSIVGNNGLIRATEEYGLDSPGAILDKLREITVESFKAKGSSDVKDGMDMALCSFDKETYILEYAGANNPLVIIRNGEIIEYKASKQPIGEFSEFKPFTNHTIQLEKEDRIYLFSDGYVDQFGGEKGKKLKSRPFKNFLLEIHEKTMEEQLELLNQKFYAWKGDLEQIDDICVFGVKV